MADHVRSTYDSTGRTTRERYKLRVSRRWFPWIWAGIVGLHLLSMGFFFVTGCVYVFLTADGAGLAYTIELYDMSVPRRHYPSIAGLYFIIGGYHLWGLVRILVASIRLRRLCFRVGKSTTSMFPHVPRRRVHVQEQRQQQQQQQPGLGLSARVRAVVIRQWTRWTSVLDIRDPNYATFYTTREVVQAGLQTYQAYRMSCLVASPWMNSMMAAVIVLNCWSTAIIHALSRTEVPRTRLACQAASMLLDLVVYVAVPVALFRPYHRDYDAARGDFPLRLWYTDTWVNRALLEGQMLLVTSWVDGLSKLIIAYNLMRTLETLASVLRVEKKKPMTVGSPGRDHRRLTTQIVPQAAVRSLTISVEDLKSWLAEQQWTTYEAVARRLLLLFGFGVLVVHVIAITRTGSPQCKIQIRPWFSWRAACSLMEINNDGGELSADSSSTLRTILEPVDESWLSFLIIRHCRNVEITAEFQRLRNVDCVKLHNSSIRRWDVDAAFTAETHPRIKILLLVDVNMTELPRGLYHPSYPPTLLDIEISRSNLTTLPAELPRVWPPGLLFVLEECAFDEFPMTSLEIRPSFLSVALNDFRTIPDVVWETPGLEMLAIGGNPYESIPPTTGHVPDFYTFRMERTEIRELPPWMDDKFFSDLRPPRAGGTPLCELLADVDAVAANATLRLWRSYVDCTPVEDSDDLRQYPLAHELVYNPPVAS